MSPQTPPQPLSRLHELDGLRGLLALYVALYHLAAPLSQPGMALAWLRPLLDPAWFAVDMFFVMSGFVMAHVYGTAFTPPVGAATLRRFFVARLARLYPVHLFALLVMAVGIVPFIHHTPAFTDPDGRFAWSAALASLLMLHGPWLDHRSWNYPAWSISAEWHAYLLFALIFPMLAQALARWPARWQSGAALALIAVGVAIPFALYRFGTGSGNEMHPTNGLPVLARVLPLFLAGVAAHRLRTAAVTGHNGFALLAVGGIAWLLFSDTTSHPHASAAAVLLAPALLLATQGHAGLRRAMSRPALLWLGAISYSLYMTHALVEMYGVNLALRWSARFGGVDLTAQPLAAGAVLVAATLAALALGAFTWRWVELPGRRWVMRWADAPRSAQLQRAGAP